MRFNHLHIIVIIFLFLPFSEINGQKILPRWVHKAELNGNFIPLKLKYQLSGENQLLRLYLGDRGSRSFHPPYYFRIGGKNRDWTFTQNKYIDIIGLRYGWNTISIYPLNYGEKDIDNFRLFVPKPFFLSAWFIVLIAFIGLALPIPGFILFTRYRKNRSDLELTRARNLKTQTLMAFKNRMNSHFLYNSMATIQGLVVGKNIQKTMDYVTDFGLILRKSIKFAEQNWIPLSEEIEGLETYLRLESIRFEGTFNWEISLPEKPYNPSMPVPPLFLHPLVERLIVVGTQTNGKAGNLSIKFNISEKNKMLIIIENDWAKEISPRLKETKYEDGGFWDMEPIRERLNNFYHAFGGATITEKGFEFKKVKIGSRTTLEIPLLSMADMRLK